MFKSLKTEPAIYVACLAAYNNGTLHGEWINLAQDIEDVWKDIRRILKNSPEPDAEEWAIHDYAGFDGLKIGEYENIESIHELAAFIEENGDLGSALLAYHDGDVSFAESSLENYFGCYSSLEEYVQEKTEETTVIPEHLAAYIDYASMARDLELSGDVFTIETAHDEIHVFLSY